MKKVLCELNFAVKLIAEEPILLKKARDKNVNEPDKFLQAYNPQTQRNSYCIPGSSLKGVIRGYSEKILRSFDENFACDPLEDPKKEIVSSCSNRIQKLKENRAEKGQDVSISGIFKELCPVCQIFGCTSYAGRVEVNDAFPNKENANKQTGIAIDRFTGGVKSHALYTREPLLNTQFPAVISIKNFEIWQIALLALVFRDMSSGIAKLGSGTRTGYGHIDAKVDSIELRYIKAAYSRAFDKSEGIISGVSSLINDHDKKLYNIRQEKPFVIDDKVPEQNQDEFSLWLKYSWADSTSIDNLLEKCVTDYLTPLLLSGFDYTEV